MPSDVTMTLYHVFANCIIIYLLGLWFMWLVTIHIGYLISDAHIIEITTRVNLDA